MKLRIHAIYRWWFGPLQGSHERARHSVPAPVAIHTKA